MLFKTKNGLFVNIKNIKIIEKREDSNSYLVTMIDNTELGFTEDSAKKLIKAMGVVK